MSPTRRARLDREPFMQPPTSVVDKSQWVNGTEKVLAAAVVTMFIAMVVFVTVVSMQLSAARAVAERVQQQSYEDRSVDCRVLIALGQPLNPRGGSCYEPEVVKFYDPEQTPAPTRLTPVICGIGREMGLKVDELSEACAPGVDGDE